MPTCSDGRRPSASTAGAFQCDLDQVRRMSAKERIALALTLGRQGKIFQKLGERLRATHPELGSRTR